MNEVIWALVIAGSVGASGLIVAAILELRKIEKALDKLERLRGRRP